MGGLITVYDPQGNRGQIPEDQLQAAVKAGGMPAVKMRDPQGNEDYVPANRTHDAIAAGGKLVPLEDQDTQHPGLWKTLADAGSAMWQHVKEIPSSLAGPDPLADPRVSDEEKNKIVAQQQAQAAATNEARRQAHGEGYSLAATAGEMMGMPVASAEKHAEEGNVGGVIGDVAFMPATVAVTHGLTKAAPKVYDFGANLAENLKETTPKQAAQAVGGATGAVAGHGTLSAPGAFYGAKTAGKLTEFVLGKERANQPIVKSPVAPDATGQNVPYAGGEEPDLTGQNKPYAGGLKFPRLTVKNPSGPLPEAPGGALQQAAALRGTSAPELAAALGRIPLAQIPTKTVLQAVDELGAKATTEQLEQRANEIMNAPATPKGLQYPPQAPETPLQPSKPSPQDVAETADIRERAKQTFEREQRTAQRIAKGEYKERNDVSVPKGTLNQSLDTTQSDVSIVDRSAAKTPEPKQLPDIADPQQAMRQLENLQKAGASPKAIQEFEGRAATRFGDNWKHIAGQADDLLDKLNQSLKNANAQKKAAGS